MTSTGEKEILPFFVEKILSENFSSNVVSSYEKISSMYRGKGVFKSSLKFEEDDINAYGWARMPATSAVADSVLQRLLERYPSFKPSSFLDLGSGLGSFLWAMLNYFPELQKSVLCEGNTRFLKLLKCFLNHEDATKYLSLKNTSLVPGNLTQGKTWDLIKDSFDLVSVSYVFSELDSSEKAQFLENAWSRTKHVLILTEPGTPEGFSNILRARDFLIGHAGKILAPCPHQNACPLYQKPKDWCHFSIRLLRSDTHKAIKNASLSYEDEKYCYLIALKHSSNLQFKESRILKKPLKRSGHIMLDLCTEEGERRLTFSKKDRGLYKLAQKKKWGDLWDSSNNYK